MPTSQTPETPTRQEPPNPAPSSAAQRYRAAQNRSTIPRTTYQGGQQYSIVNQLGAPTTAKISSERSWTSHRKLGTISSAISLLPTPDRPPLSARRARWLCPTRSQPVTRWHAARLTFSTNPSRLYPRQWRLGHLDGTDAGPQT
jgi:hypothetical protein